MLSGPTWLICLLFYYLENGKIIFIQYIKLTFILKAYLKCILELHILKMYIYSLFSKEEKGLTGVFPTLKKECETN
jgi:hypothetical protein